LTKEQTRRRLFGIERSKRKVREKKARKLTIRKTTGLSGARGGGRAIKRAYDKREREPNEAQFFPILLKRKWE